MRTIILLGSSRSQGDTFQLCRLLTAQTAWPLVDLQQFHIEQFDYHFTNRDDDYLPLVRRLIADYDRWVFATPVYWYSMSGILKKFVDRFSDLLNSEKALGRQLRGKHLAVLACGYDQSVDPAFWMPFQRTADYLGMHYDGEVYGYLRAGIIPEAVADAVEHFAQRLQVLGA